ncbi:MAG: type II toxin-antitoxin system VapC family toxin [Leptospiraceae bacterium]|nr:type II toxin-antitoxin system VapC family toxin [Leptospiraceae bacterium]
MRSFFDTSALIKKYIDEVGSDTVTKLVLESDEIVLSPITRMEFISALQRLINTGFLLRKDYEITIEEFQLDMTDFDFVEFNQTLELLVIELIKKYGLRSLDGIQLASAKIANPDRFITSDKKLYEASQKELQDKETIYISNSPKNTENPKVIPA